MGCRRWAKYTNIFKKERFVGLILHILIGRQLVELAIDVILKTLHGIDRCTQVFVKLQRQ